MAAAVISINSFVLKLGASSQARRTSISAKWHGKYGHLLLFLCCTSSHPLSLLPLKGMHYFKWHKIGRLVFQAGYLEQIHASILGLGLDVMRTTST